MWGLRLVSKTVSRNMLIQISACVKTSSCKNVEVLIKISNVFYASTRHPKSPLRLQTLLKLPDFVRVEVAVCWCQYSSWPPCCCHSLLRCPRLGCYVSLPPSSPSKYCYQYCSHWNQDLLSPRSGHYLPLATPLTLPLTLTLPASMTRRPSPAEKPTRHPPCQFDSDPLVNKWTPAQWTTRHLPPSLYSNNNPPSTALPLDNPPEMSFCITHRLCWKVKYLRFPNDSVPQCIMGNFVCLPPCWIKV